MNTQPKDSDAMRRSLTRLGVFLLFVICAYAFSTSAFAADSVPTITALTATPQYGEAGRCVVHYQFTSVRYSGLDI